MKPIWYSIALGNGAEAFAPTQQIQQAFLVAFKASGGDINMAIFSRNDLEADNITVYFSPAAATVARAFTGAVPCDRPNRERLGLLVGDQRCWSVLFPAD